MKKILTAVFIFLVFISLYFSRADFSISDNAEGKNNYSQNNKQTADNLIASSFLSGNIENNETSYKQCYLKIEAKAGLIKYLSHNRNIFELNPDKHWSIASISKLMAAIVAFEQIGASREIKIDAKSVATEGISGEFKEGDFFSSLDLIKAMLLVSSNDAATALAGTIGEETFMKLMNQKAQELKMSDTIYFNPSGLSFLNQSTPNDLAKLANYIYNDRQKVFDITKQKEITIKELGFQKTRNLANINQLSGRNDFIGGPPNQGEARLKIEFLGGKTGYLDESGRNLISLFNINNQPILTVILGAEDAYKETEKMLTCISPTLF